MAVDVATRKCLACEKVLKGRTDKKFCNDYCRNSFNNQKKPKPPQTIKMINQLLMKNRATLEKMLGSLSMKKVGRDEMLLNEFSFRFCTHTVSNKEGKTYFFCYDYGYLDIGANSYLIVKQRNQF